MRIDKEIKRTHKILENFYCKSKKSKMQQLIKIKEQNGNRAVSARELHKFLGVETQFTKWCERMFEYGFEENEDFILVKNDQNKVSKSNPIDYALTIDTAKEISMLQRTDKGKQARRYFIEMEKVATNQIQAPAIGKRSNSIVDAKKNELVGIIKTFLVHGDITNIANDLKIKASKVQDVFNSRKADKKVIEACFLKAKKNKEELLFGYEEMIDMLKNENK